LSRSRTRCFSAAVDEWVRHLDLLLEPLLLVVLLDVHVLDADGAGVGVAQHAEDVAQRHDLARQTAGADVADRELAVEVPDRELVVGMSSSGWVSGARRPSGSRLAIKWPRTRYHVDEGVHLHDLLVLGRRIGEAAAVREPARRLVGNGQAREHLVVELVLAEQELVDAPEELAALGAGDDAVVVGVGERGDLAHRELRERGGGRRLRTRRGSRCCRRRR